MSAIPQAWREAYSFIRCDTDAMFDFTDEDFQRVANLYADTGATAVITFSNTHFRLTFRPYWPIYNEALRRLTEACHRRGLKVIEHHSCSLAFRPRDEAEFGYLARIVGCDPRQPDARFAQILPYVTGNPEIDGVPFTSLFQIAGDTGQPGRTPYKGFAACYNNPDYRRIYFRYLEDVYRTGVDGIMTDDVQFFGTERYGRGQSCTCSHCRALFRDKTGYELPAPEDWATFYENYQNPVFVAWKRFKSESTADFQFTVNRHFESLGLKLMRPNYISEILGSNWTAYPFESAARLWTAIFQENCHADIIRGSYLTFAGEAVHRNSLAARNQVPSMSMFYPDRAESFYFSWACAMSWGQLYLGTREASVISDAEKQYRTFERAHADYLLAPRREPELGLYYSRQSRDYTAQSDRNMAHLRSWLQAAYLGGYATVLAFDDDKPEEWSGLPWLIVASAEMLSDAELTRFADYARGGGRLLLAGDCGRLKPDGSARPVAELLELLEVNAELEAVADPQAGGATLAYEGRVARFRSLPCRQAFTSGQCQVLLHTDGGQVAGIRASIGKGEILLMPDSVNNGEFQGKISQPRGIDAEVQTQPPVRMPTPIAPLLAATNGAVLRALIPHRRLELQGGGNLHGALFTNAAGDGLAIHVLNVNRLFDDFELSHTSPIPSFVAGHLIEEAVVVHLRGSGDIRQATLYSPEKEGSLALEMERLGDQILLHIPARTFGSYALIEVGLA